MKQFFTILGAAMAITVSAQPMTQLLPVNKSHKLKHTPSTECRTAATLSPTAHPLARNISGMPVTKDNDGETTIIQVPDGEWTPIGTGTWVEGNFTEFGADDELRWPVEIEQSVEQPGWYRTIPYGDASAISQIIGVADNTTYVYINATDPGRVYIPEFEVYNHLYPFCQLVPENDWGNQWMEYGYLEDGVISFDEGTFVVWYMDRWNLCGDGNMKIGLPGVKIPDYRMAIDAPFCADGNNLEVEMVYRGEDVATLKAMVSPGLADLYSGNSQLVAEFGTEVDPAAGKLAVDKADLDKRGLYTYYLVGLDNTGKIVNAATITLMAEFDNDADWQPLGIGTLYEGIVSPFYSDVAMQLINVEIEQHKERPAYFRLKNPMQHHPQLSQLMTTGHDHNHYIYINAEDPDGGVYIEASSLGIETPNGQAAVWSQYADYLEQGLTPEYLKSYALGGSMTDDGEITFPDDTILYAERGYKYGRFVTSGDRLRIKLYEQVGIDGIQAEDDAPATYFNLQGIQVANPAKGSIMIRMQGGKASKIRF